MWIPYNLIKIANILAQYAFPKHTIIKNLVHIDSWSSQNKTEEIQHILYEINTKLSTEIHIITITEHWIILNETQPYVFEQYNTVFSGRQRKAGGGSAIFVLNPLKYEIINKYTDNEYSIISNSIQINPKTNIKFVISFIYRPSNLKTKQFQRFRQILKKIIWRD